MDIALMIAFGPLTGWSIAASQSCSNFAPGGETVAELDLAFRDGRLVIGEVKTSPHEFDDTSLNALTIGRRELFTKAEAPGADGRVTNDRRRQQTRTM
jgi:hypothetical protein